MKKDMFYLTDKQCALVMMALDKCAYLLRRSIARPNRSAEETRLGEHYQDILREVLSLKQDITEWRLRNR